MCSEAMTECEEKLTQPAMDTVAVGTVHLTVLEKGREGQDVSTNEKDRCIPLGRNTQWFYCSQGVQTYREESLRKLRAKGL